MGVKTVGPYLSKSFTYKDTMSAVPPIMTSSGQVNEPEVTPSSEDSNPSNRNRRRFPRRSDNQIMSESRSFVGETPELGAVVGLLSEWLDKGVTMEQFQEKLKLYVSKKTIRRAKRR